MRFPLAQKRVSVEPRRLERDARTDEVLDRLDLAVARYNRKSIELEYAVRKREKMAKEGRP